MRPGESFVEQPIRSLQTMLRVLAKDDPQLPSVVPDGIYGPSTTTAVSAFQRREGIPGTGITDQNTWDAIVQQYELALIRVGAAQPINIHLDPNQVLRNGDSSPYIFLLQSMLKQLSIDHNRIPPPSHTGILDSETAASLEAFQSLSGLPISGEFDKITWKHLVHQYSLSAVAHNNRTMY